MRSWRRRCSYPTATWGFAVTLHVDLHPSFNFQVGGGRIWKFDPDFQVEHLSSWKLDGMDAARFFDSASG